MKKDIVTNITKLKIKSEEISLKETNSIIKDLEDTLKEYPNGIGLSAMQIGISKKVGIIRIHQLKINLINPKIIDKEFIFKMEKEGCLSFPNLNLDTIRYNNITIINGDILGITPAALIQEQKTRFPPIINAVPTRVFVSFHHLLTPCGLALPAVWWM